MSFHEPPVPLAGMVIDFDRSLYLHALDPSWTGKREWLIGWAFPSGIHQV